MKRENGIYFSYYKYTDDRYPIQQLVWHQININSYYSEQPKTRIPFRGID